MRAIFLAFAAMFAVVSASAAPDGGFARRWFLVFGIDFKKDDAQAAKLMDIMRTAKEHGYNGMIFSSWCGFEALHTPYWSQEDRERLMKVKRLADELGLEIGVSTWSFGYARQGFFNVDPNLSAAAPVFDTRYVVKGGKCVHLPRPERSLLAAPAPLHSPRRDEDVADMRVDVSPRRSYALSVTAKASGKTADWPISVHVRRPGAEKDFLEARVFKVKTDGSEQKFEVLFASLAETNLTIDCRGYNRVFGGHAEVTSITLSETEPRLAIRRSGTPIRVRRVKDGRKFVEGVDYAPIPKAKGTWPGPWVKPKFAVTPLAGGAMAEGDEISVDCFCSFPTWGRWTSACMASPEMFEVMDASAAEIARVLNPKVWSLGFDEVRTGGGCVDCRKIGDMAHIYAACVKKAMAIVRKYRPDAEIFLPNDMVDPFYMMDDGKYAGLYSSMKGVWDLLPRDLGIDCWTYSTREKCPQYFAERGHPIWIAAYYDEKELKRSVEWRDIARKVPGVVGMTYCTYGNNWILLGPFGDMIREP